VLDHWRHHADPAPATIDTDALAHRFLEPDTETYRAVVEEFGEEILSPNRTVDRDRLGDIVFGDSARRGRLNEIIHPAVRRAWQGEVERLETSGGTAAVVVVIPLLYEVGAADSFDAVVVVGCSEATQLARLGARGLGERPARARMAAQWPIREKMDRADYVIWNDGTRRVLEQQADAVWSRLQEDDHVSNKD
jgi:dephospho-CoA kinase